MPSAPHACVQQKGGASQKKSDEERKSDESLNAIPYTLNRNITSLILLSHHFHPHTLSPPRNFVQDMVL